MRWVYLAVVALATMPSVWKCYCGHSLKTERALTGHQKKCKPLKNHSIDVFRTAQALDESDARKRRRIDEDGSYLVRFNLVHVALCSLACSHF